MNGYTANKDDYLKRLRRIEGQTRGLQKMIEEDKYCIDVLTQISAATKALQSVALGLLDEHMVDAAKAGGQESEAKVPRPPMPSPASSAPDPTSPARNLEGDPR